MDSGGGEVGWANVWKTQEGAVPSLTDIYSLAQPLKTAVQVGRKVDSACTVHCHWDLKKCSPSVGEKSIICLIKEFYQNVNFYFLVMKKRYINFSPLNDIQFVEHPCSECVLHEPIIVQGR